MKHLKLSLVLATAALCALATPSRGAEIEGVEFAEQLEGEDLRLTLQGVGLLRYRVLFKGYVAALYLPPGTHGEAALEDVPKRLEIEYFWKIDGDAFGRAADVFLEKNLAPAELARLQPRIGRMHELFRSVQPGDRYALTYVPGRGTELALNGEPLGVVPGADFAEAYFGIWLGEEPIDGALRRQLVTGG